MTTWETYKAILMSARFQQMMAAFLIMVSAHYGWIDAWLAEALTALLAGSVTINTVDRFSAPKQTV